MTAKTRYFLFGSVLILTVGLSIGLVAFYGGMAGSLFAGQQSLAELKYVPADAAVVAYANVRDVMNSQMRQRLRQFDGMTDQGRSEFKDKTGIDIEQDIDHVVAFMGAKGSTGNRSGLVVATGRFDQGRLQALAVENGAKVEQYKGKTLMSALVDKAHPGETAPEGSMAVAFLGPNLVAMGGIDMVRQSIDRAGGSTSVQGNADVMKLVGEMNDASVWAVGNFDALRAEVKLPNEVSDRIPSISWFSANAHVNGGMQATVKAETKDEQAANNLRDIIRGFTALARMQTGSNPELQKVMPDIQLGGDGKIVSVSFALTTEMLDAIMAARGAAGAIKKSQPKPTPKQ
jgi:hypothetical protein